MKTSSAKAKGRRCAQAVKELMLRFCSALEQDDIAVTSSGETGADLKLSPRAQSYYPFVPECKNTERMTIWADLDQAEAHTGKGTPVLFFKRNRSKIYIALEAEAFFELVRGHVQK
jgi:hypothetical protein